MWEIDIFKNQISKFATTISQWKYLLNGLTDLNEFCTHTRNVPISNIFKWFKFCQNQKWNLWKRPTQTCCYRFFYRRQNVQNALLHLVSSCSIKRFWIPTPIFENWFLRKKVCPIRKYPPAIPANNSSFNYFRYSYLSHEYFSKYSSQGNHKVFRVYFALHWRCTNADFQNMCHRE